MSARPLVMFAFADPEPTRPLREVRREKDELRDILDPVIRRGVLDRPEVLEHATADRIVRSFRRDNIHGLVRAFHFSGHASPGELMLAHVHGHDVAPAGPLADYLGAQPGLELVVLNACSTQPQVERLRRAGIQGVVATSRAIRDDVAADFGVHFWSELRLKPLRRAFDAAIAATQFTGSGQARQLWSEHTRAPEEELPWQLECADDEWTLAPSSSSPHGGSSSAPIDRRALVDQLAEAACDANEAVLLAKRAGVPPSRIPAFTNSLVFWSKVVEDAACGMLRGKVQPIVDAAARMYPHNEFFARHRSPR